MASKGRSEDTGLNRDLLRAPGRFGFFQLVRLLQHRRREKQGGPLGSGEDDPRREPLQFRAEPSLRFPGASVRQVREAAADARDDADLPPAEVEVTFLGLTGPNGVLPRHYTELMIERNRERDTSLRDFLDIFNHRLIALFHAAWEKYRLPIGYERSQLDAPPATPDQVTRALHSLVGFGTEGLRGRLRINDEVFLHYGGHFAHFPRSASALEALVQDFLEVPTQVLQLQGEWLRLDPDDQTRMPVGRRGPGRNTELGINAVVGSRVWGVEGRFRIRLGPLNWLQFRALMPDGPSLLPLCHLTRTFVGVGLDFDVQPLLKAEDVPDCQLTSDTESGPRLGWNTWMGSRPRLEPVADAVFSCSTT